MAKGKSAEETLEILIAEDEERELRQVGIVDALGNSASFTGADCPAWAGGVTGENYAIQGNIVVSKATIDAMERTFLETEGDLAYRLLEALTAGQAAGGDSRGKQSAALVVVQAGGGYFGYDDRKFDLRVDEHVKPITELKRIVAIYREFSRFWRPDRGQ